MVRNIGSYESNIVTNRFHENYHNQGVIKHDLIIKILIKITIEKKLVGLIEKLKEYRT